MFELWSDNVNLATRWDLEEARKDASYMSDLWKCNIAIWVCDNEGDFFVEMIETA